MSDDVSTVERFAGGLTEQSQPAYVLRLYVSGATPRSVEAIKNVKDICDASFPGRYTLEVVDIFQQPDRAALDEVVAVPMLVKQLPLPMQKLIGTLPNIRQVLHASGLEAPEGNSARAHRG
jgi:circadian clock protein KaiB